MNSQNMLDALMNNTNRMIYFKDLEGRYTFVNREWLAATGLSEHHTLGRSDHELFGPDWAGIFRRNDLEVSRTRQPLDFEEQVTLPDGRVVISHSIKFPVYDNQGRLSGTGSISSDITGRKQLEESLLRSNQTKDKFFSIIAHDLKNPLNGLLGLTDLMLDEINLADPRQIEREIRLINQTTKVLHSLLDNLLTWARSQTGLLEYCPRYLPLSSLVNECVELVRPALLAKRLTLHADIAPDLKAMIDPQMTSTILRNLLVNAIKYSHSGNDIRITALTCDNWMVLEIADQGVGIAPGRLPRLFQLESKSSTQGTDGEMGSGLGLLLCKDFAERQQGRIEVESELGKGTVMRVRLPRQDSNGQPVKIQA